jgi:hypothetical protein
MDNLNFGVKSKDTVTAAWYVTVTDDHEARTHVIDDAKDSCDAW